ncbi:IS110 family transposase [Mesorhizobium sp. AR02]|uniref:IS110 family transposase n=1 Tax=Mesorhizobium sp. AR02 TaxID=2865837 RepID=UPI002160FE8C|nr:transposase [Mesorhizobium sp. AR02]
MAFLHQQPSLCLGLDIAKDTITAADGTTTQVIDNQRRTIRAFLKSHKQADLVVCEPTGGHESLLLEECLRAGIACHRADTLKVKSFIRSYGTHGKSDAIDAAMLRAYGRERWEKLTLWQAPDPDETRLRALVRRRPGTHRHQDRREEPRQGTWWPRARCLLRGRDQSRRASDPSHRCSHARADRR